MSTNVRVAIAHDYLTQRGGAERVVLAIARAYPEAPIYTMLYEPESTFPEFAGYDVRPSFLNHWAWPRTHHRACLPVLPLVASSIHIQADVIIASSSGWSHGFRGNGKNVVYCYSPARWLYQSEAYIGQSSTRTARAGLGMLKTPLQHWDQRAAHRADRYLAISKAVRDRIQSTYGIASEVVPAPRTLPSHVSYEPDSRGASGDYFLCVARLLPYKNVDAVVRAFAGRRENLVVVGKGPELAQLRNYAGPNVTFHADLSDAEMVGLYRGCRAVIAASYEDYGLSPLEAAAAGKPALALRWGGFLDTVLEGRTGVYFDVPTPESIRIALDRFQHIRWDSKIITEWAQNFSEERFARTLRRVLTEVEGSGAPATARELVSAAAWS